MLKHQFSPVVGLRFSGASWFGGISGMGRCGSVFGTGGIISGSGRLGWSMFAFGNVLSKQPRDVINVPVCRTFGPVRRYSATLFPREQPMPETRTQNSDFNRAFGDAKKQAANVAGEVQDAAGDIYGQARDSASSVADATKTAARKTAGSFEKALRNTVETQPYTAVAIALGLGWLFGRMHRPL
jgi:ElaB/YqjD/DUF883 family membrane-anchored ribosome-binding protein